MTTRLSLLGLSSGKVPKKPSLEKYDNVSYRTMPSVAPVTSEFGTFLGLEREYASTHERDRDLLIALGVDGTVPLAQARVNAATANYNGGITPHEAVAYMRSLRAANDNHELAAQAA